MRFSSSFKVGILALIALFILLFTILWVKGRSFSSAERIEIAFKDVNGMRPGSGVQMMGLRVGQVEEITPFIDGENSYVKMRFVITEPGITIPKASVFSIQQSGLIGEQFLEITPPKTRITYFPVRGSSDLPYKNDPVQIKLDNKYYDVGKVKDTQVLSAKMIPAIMQEKIKTPYAYKIDYVITLPGLVLPEYMFGTMIKDKGVNKLRLNMLDDTILPYPHQNSPYTIIEPIRIADFMDLQYKAAESLTETNIKINELLSDNVIADLKQTAANINALTAQATTTMAKAEKLVDASKEDLDAMVAMANKVSVNFIKLTDNINEIIGDKNFRPTLLSAAKSIDKLSQNLNKILDNTDAKQLGADLQSVAANLNDISAFVAAMTKDEKLKKQLFETVAKVNTAMVDISNALELVNSMTPDNKRKIEQIMDDTSKTTRNLRKFSDKLNKRFLLFRLMF